MEVKAVFFDIDGTLLDHSGGQSVLPASAGASLEALHRKGIKVFVATGRDRDMLPQIRAYFPFDGFVTLNGQLVLDKDEKVLHRMAHHSEDIRQLIPLVHKAGFPAIIVEERCSFPVTDTPAARMIFQFKGMELPPLYDPARLEEHPVLQFLAFMPLEQGREVLSVLPHVHVTSAGGDILDVIPKGGGKEVGIAAAAAYYGFRREEVMVFGDGDNDATMLSWAGTGVAMGNGSPAAKAAGDYVTAPVGEDGVQKALLHFGVLSPEDL